MLSRTLINGNDMKFSHNIIIMLFIILYNVFIGSAYSNAIKWPEHINIIDNYIISQKAATKCLKKPFADEAQFSKYQTNFLNILIATLIETQKLNKEMSEKEITTLFDKRKISEEENTEKYISKKSCNDDKVKTLLKMHDVHKNMPSFSEWKKK